MTVDVVSAIYGNYETPKVPVQQEGIEVREWIVVTDNPELEAPGWRVVVERRPHVHSNVAAKIPKFLPHLYSDADFTLWIDGHALIQPSLVAHAVKTVTGYPMAMYPHPQRVRLDDEVKASRGLPKYDGLPMEEQIKHYRHHGHRDTQLWATGCIARDHSFNSTHTMIGLEWLEEIVRWSFQDQLSFAFLAERHKLDIAKLGPDLWNTEHIWWGNHG